MQVSYGSVRPQPLKTVSQPGIHAARAAQPRFGEEAKTPGTISSPSIDKLTDGDKAKALEALAELNKCLPEIKAVVLKKPEYEPNIYYPIQKHIQGFYKAIDTLRGLTQATAESPLVLVVSKPDTLENMCLLGADFRQVAWKTESGEKVSLKGTLMQWGRFHDADLSQIDPTGARFYQTAYSPKTKFPAGFNPRKADMYVERDRLKKLFKPVGEFLDKVTQKPRTFFKKKMDQLKEAWNNRAKATQNKVEPTPAAEVKAAEVKAEAKTETAAAQVTEVKAEQK